MPYYFNIPYSALNSQLYNIIILSASFPDKPNRQMAKSFAVCCQMGDVLNIHIITLFTCTVQKYSSFCDYMVKGFHENSAGNRIVMKICQTSYA